MFDRLPVELIELVLSDEYVTATDIASVAVTCSRLHLVVANSNDLWRNKFRQRFADLLPMIGVTNDPWREWYKRVVQCSREVRSEIERMSSLYYRKEHLSTEAFTAVVQLTDNYSHGYDLIVHELRNLMTRGRRWDNLTVKYYAEKTLSFVRQSHLRTIWQEFLKLPPSEQSIEKGAILIGQWFQPAKDLCECRDFKMPLEALARLAKGHLSTNHPDHPLVQRHKLVEDEFLVESLWNPYQCSQVLACLNATLFGELGFHGEQNDYYSPENSYLNMVLTRKAGIPISLSVVYMSVARRLGVVCEPVAFPAHFFLRFCARPDHPDLAQRYAYVDAFNNGRLMMRNEMRCPYARDSSALPTSAYASASPLVVLERMTRNLVEVGRREENLVTRDCLCYGLQLLSILRPDDVESTLLMARIYLNLGINLKEVLSTLQEVLSRDPSQAGIVAHMYQLCMSRLNDAQQYEGKSGCFATTTAVARRPANGSVLYYVGMIMVHELYNYSCVIFGWDAHCSASREWIAQMSVDELFYKEFQPFYNVLVADGSVRYVAQENLRVAVDPMTMITDHPYVGKYFTMFNGTRFVPNDEKRREYPDDEDALNALHSFRN